MTRKPYVPSDYWEERLQQSFNLRGVGHRQFSESYNAWLYRRKARVLAERLGAESLRGTRVLDVGCGTGFFVEWYTQRGAEVTGVDITQVSIEQLRLRFPGGAFHTRDITAPDFDLSERFAIVNMWDVMYHIVDAAKFERALANIDRHLAPGGRFLITDWFGVPADTRIAEHVQARTLGTYQAALGARGFELESLGPLYRALNRRIISGADNLLAPLYYFLDGFARAPSRRNLSLAVWRKAAPPR